MVVVVVAAVVQITDNIYDKLPWVSHWYTTEVWKCDSYAQNHI